MRMTVEGWKGYERGFVREPLGSRPAFEQTGNGPDTGQIEHRGRWPLFSRTTGHSQLTYFPSFRCIRCAVESHFKTRPIAIPMIEWNL